MRRTTLFAACCAALVMASLTGCGGGGNNPAPVAANTGRAVITLVWPERAAASRLIPAGANSINVTFSVGGVALQSAVIARPTTTLQFSNLPAGTLLVEATAHPNADGTGATQARADSFAVIVSGQKTPVNLTLATTIASVKITPETIAFTGDPVTLTATAYDGADATGNIVLSGAWSWSNSNPGVLNVVAQGDKAVITPVSAGVSNVTVTETESGKSYTKPINVAPR